MFPQSSNAISAANEVQFWHSGQLTSSYVTTKQGALGASPRAAHNSCSAHVSLYE